MSKGSDAPQPPDPVKVAQAQADVNRVVNLTPYGNQLWGTINQQGEFVPNLSGQQAASVIEETPFQGEFRGIGEGTALDLANALAPNAGGLQGIDLSGLPDFTSGLDFSQFSPVPTSDQFSEDANRVEQATYQRMANLLNPQFDLQERRLEGRLADQGLPMGGEAYGGEMSRFGDVRSRALEDAALQAVNAGRAEQGRLFGQALTSRGAQIGDALTNAQLAQSARAGTLGEQSGIRAQQLGELAALLGGQAYNPSQAAAFTPGGMIDVAGPMRDQYEAQLAAWQQGQQNQAAGLGGLFSIGSGALMAGLMPGGFLSDREAKEEIDPLSDAETKRLAELPISTWKYKGDETKHVGAMAQDLKKLGVGDGKTVPMADVAGLVEALLKRLAQHNRQTARA